MSEMSRKARADGRAKIKRLMVDPKGKIDASGWEPPEALMAGRKVYDKAKERSATTKIYKHGGRIQGDRGPRRRDKIARGHKADGGVPATRFNEGPIEHSNFMNRGGKTGCEHMARGGKIRTGNHGGDGYYEGTRPIGGRIARAHGGRAKGKTNIVINIGEKGGQQPMPPMPPIQAPTRPPMMPPGPPPGMAGPPGGPGGPPMPPPSMAGGPPPGMMPRKRGGRTNRDDGGRAQWAMGRQAKNLRDDNEVTDTARKTGGDPVFDPMAPEQASKRLRDTGSLKYKKGGRTIKPKQGVDVHMSAGAGGGLGRLEKARRYGAHQS